MMSRICKHCKCVFLPCSPSRICRECEFQKMALRSLCAKERASRPKKKYKCPTDKIKARDYGLKRKYGISLENFNARYTEQDGKCAICKCPIEASGQQTHVDHSHVTGRVRALLCSGCNYRLGIIECLGDRLSAFTDYLKKYDPLYEPAKI